MTQLKRWILIAFALNLLVSLIPSSFLLYVAFQHNPQWEFHSPETGVINLAATAKFLLLNMAILFSGLTGIEFAGFILVWSGRRLLKR